MFHTISKMHGRTWSHGIVDPNEEGCGKWYCTEKLGQPSRARRLGLAPIHPIRAHWSMKSMIEWLYLICIYWFGPTCICNRVVRTRSLEALTSTIRRQSIRSSGSLVRQSITDPLAIDSKLNPSCGAQKTCRAWDAFKFPPAAFWVGTPSTAAVHCGLRANVLPKLLLSPSSLPILRT